MNINITLVLQEIASVNANFEAQRAKNESLKRMKVYSYFLWHSESPFLLVSFWRCPFRFLLNSFFFYGYFQLDVGLKYHQNNPSSTSVEPQCVLAGQPHQRIVVSSEALIRPIQDDTHSHASESRPNKIESTTGKSFFLIPDLNMVPSEDVSCTDALCGMSWDLFLLLCVLGIQIWTMYRPRELFEGSIQ